MNPTRLLGLTLIVFCSTILSLHAQVPQLINYQGRMVAGGTNFDGPGRFKFALVNADGSASFWSNDGTSVGGSQPAAQVTLPVTRGLYSVLLGDTTIAGMSVAIPVTVFTNPDVRLRVWFNDNVTGFQQLTPDQRIAAVGYAMMGATVPDGVITSAKIAPGAIGTTQLADGAVTGGKIGPGAVTSATLAHRLAVGGDGDGELRMLTSAGVETVVIQAAKVSGAGSRIILRDNTGTPTITLDAEFNGDGRITTQELSITGGSDLSEQFNIKAGNEVVQPGMVVCIDPKNPGELVMSTQAYDRTAAGVVSGAGGVKPGMLMGQMGTMADGNHPVALTGRVYCMVDTGFGAIEPGDMITTSDTPGHGMKVTDHARAQGAIVGKAMTGLQKGKGLVLVLVTLQ